MPAHMSAKFDPFELAEKGGSWIGSIPIRQLQRLRLYLQVDAGEVAAEIHFAVDPTGQPYATGSLSGRFRLVCQRCLETVDLPFDHTFNIGFVRSEAEMDQLALCYDPMVVDEGACIHINDLVEDELILLIPIVPKHDDMADCAFEKVYS